MFLIILSHSKDHRSTINVHMFSHLHEIRKRTGVPLWVTSAEDFESVYAVMRRCYWSGTKNTPKQILENYYLRILYDSMLFPSFLTFV